MNADNLQIALVILVPVFIVAFWLWMLADCILNKKLSGKHKVIWLLVMILCPIASLFYSIWIKEKVRGPVVRLSERVGL